MKTYQETYVRFAEAVAGENGEVSITTKPLPESKATKAIEEAKKVEGANVPEIQLSQSFTFYEAENVQDALDLVNQNETEFCNIFNRGAVLKQQMAARDIVTDPEYQATAEAYDLKSEVAEVRERRKASPLEKAAKLLGLSANDLSGLLAQIQAQQAPVSQ